MLIWMFFFRMNREWRFFSKPYLLFVFAIRKYLDKRRYFYRWLSVVEALSYLCLSTVFP